jgi:hypothetical protein
MNQHFQKGKRATRGRLANTDAFRIPTVAHAGGAFSRQRMRGVNRPRNPPDAYHAKSPKSMRMSSSLTACAPPSESR